MSGELRSLWGIRVSGCIVAAAMLGVLPSVAAEDVPDRAPAFCYAPGTSQAFVDATRERALWTPASSPFSPDSGLKFQYTDGDRWRSTATDGSGLGQGDPITLTWSIVPDGTADQSGTRRRVQQRQHAALVSQRRLPQRGRLGRRVPAGLRPLGFADRDHLRLRLRRRRTLAVIVRAARGPRRRPHQRPLRSTATGGFSPTTTSPTPATW